MCKSNFTLVSYVTPRSVADSTTGNVITEPLNRTAALRHCWHLDVICVISKYRIYAEQCRRRSPEVAVLPRQQQQQLWAYHWPAPPLCPRLICQLYHPLNEMRVDCGTTCDGLKAAAISGFTDRQSPTAVTKGYSTVRWTLYMRIDNLRLRSDSETRVSNFPVSAKLYDLSQYTYCHSDQRLLVSNMFNACCGHHHQTWCMLAGSGSTHWRAIECCNTTGMKQRGRRAVNGRLHERSNC